MQFLRKSHRRNALTAAVAGMGLLGLASNAGAINIVLVYNAAASTEPAGDPTGALLTSIMQHVESTYQDVFEDTHTLTINYWYEALDPGTLGVHNLVSQSGGRENEANIRFDPTAQGSNWFFDPSPATDTEFDMAQVLWRDLTATQQTDFYNPGANIPQTFEAGYRGAGNGSNANTAGRTDLLSVAFHEVGHALGMSSSNTTTVAETGDADYDFDPVNVFGRTLAVETASATNVAHLQSSFALMNPSIGTNFRDRPSHTDLLAMAAVHNYTLLDIPRREYYGGSDWNNDANWTGNTIPSSADVAFIRAAGPAGEIRSSTLSAAGNVGTLTVAEGGNFSTGAFNLNVFSALVIDGLDSDVFVQPGGTLTVVSTATLNIQNQAELSMTGGVANAGTINNNAEIIGQGTINVSGRLNNSGSINVSGGTLVLNATGTGSINLDGSSTGTLLFSEPGDVIVNLPNSHLVVNGLLTDDFNGAMTIGNSNSVTMNDPWTLGGNSGTIIISQDGVLNLNGGTTALTGAVLNGAIVTIEGDLNVGTNGFGIINAATAFVPGATVVVNSGATLDLNGNNTFNGGSYTGAGAISFDGNTNIIGDTTFDIATFDFDGGTIVDTFTINDGVTMTVNGNVADDYDDNLAVLGTLNVNGPSWGINTGTATLNTGTIGGTAGFRVGAGHLVVTAGTSAINTTATFQATSTNTITGTLRLQGNAVINGGTWSGAGVLALVDQMTTFAGNTTLNVASFDMDGLASGTGSVNVNSGVTVTVNSAITDAFDGTLNINSGTMDVTSGAWTINSGGAVNLNDTGAGTASLLGPGLANSSGATITFSGGASSGFAGGAEGGPEAVTGGGRLGVGTFINSGRINVAPNAGGTIVGTSTFNPSGSVVINTGGQLVLAGPTNFMGGSFTGAGILTQDGDLTVRGNTTIDVATYDWDGDFFGATTVSPGVAFTINSAVIENDGNGHDSNITVASGTLTVNTSAAWRKDGAMFLINTGAGVPNVAGQDMILGGTVTTTGATQMTAGLINGGGTMNTTAGSTHTNAVFRSTAANTFNKAGPGTWVVNGPQAHVANAQLNIIAGAVKFNSDAGAGGANLRVNHSGAALDMASSQHLAGLTINAGATATINPGGNTGVLRMNSLTIAGGANPTGTLNLADETMIYDYSGATPLAAVRGWLLSGFNANTWTGDGIRSSAAAVDPANRALGYVEASAIGSPGTFAGEGIDGTTVLVRLTVQGDTNLDRVVNLDDFTNLAAAFGLPSFWSGGDFNYDAVTNLDDFTVLAAHFGQSIPADLPRGSAVPEPVAGFSLSALALLTGRRVRRQAAQ